MIHYIVVSYGEVSARDMAKEWRSQNFWLGRFVLVFCLAERDRQKDEWVRSVRLSVSFCVFYQRS